MKPSQAKRLTHGYDPLGWLAYADFLDDARGPSPESRLWRCRGEVAMALERWTNGALFATVPVDSERVGLPFGCFLKPRFSKKLLFLPLWHESRRDASEETDTVRFRVTVLDAELVTTLQLLRSSLGKDRYLRTRIITLAERCLAFAEPLMAGDL